MKQAFVALGSNLADPIQQIQTAFIALEHIPNTRVIKKSSLYQTAPIGYDAEQLSQVPDFINAVVALETDLAPLDLLDALLKLKIMPGASDHIQTPRACWTATCCCMKTQS